MTWQTALILYIGACVIYLAGWKAGIDMERDEPQEEGQQKPPVNRTEAARFVEIKIGGWPLYETTKQDSGRLTYK
ncbi:MAG TPA: hypothetical protein VF167_15365 [Longimicrobiaceae bacterium]